SRMAGHSRALIRGGLERLARCRRSPEFAATLVTGFPCDYHSNTGVSRHGRSCPQGETLPVTNLTDRALRLGLWRASRRYRYSSLWTPSPCVRLEEEMCARSSD